MNFIVKTDLGFILTDDYSAEEIEKQIHLAHIKNDLRIFGYRYADVYDNNAKLVAHIQRG